MRDFARLDAAIDSSIAAQPTLVRARTLSGWCMTGDHGDCPWFILHSQVNQLSECPCSCHVDEEDDNKEKHQ